MIELKGKKYNDEEIQEMINSSTSIREILIKLGMRGAGANHTKLKRYIDSGGFDTTTLVGRHIKRYSNKNEKKKRLSEILTKNSTGNSSRLKERLIKCGLKEWKCEKCGNSEYDGETIPLELHHVNGDHFDNRLENLLLLCPICHSRTSNFRGKHKQYDSILSEIAKNNSLGKMEKLIEKEDIESQIINLGKNLDVKKYTAQTKICHYCGKSYTGPNLKFCSKECHVKFEKENGKNKEYNSDDIIANSLKCTSIIELGKLYGITDSGIKKQCKHLGIFETVKENIRLNKYSTILQKFDIDGNFIEEIDAFILKNKYGEQYLENARACCCGQRKSAGGYIWKYKQ